MKIDPTRIDLQNTHSGAARGGASQGPAAGAGGPGRGLEGAGHAGRTRVDLSGARTPSAGRGDFDAAKVAWIGAAMALGTYRIDPAAIADGLMADARAWHAHGLL